MTDIAIHKRNILLVLAGIALILAVCTGVGGGLPSLLDLLQVLIGGYIASLCVLGVGHLIVEQPIEPWYARKWAFWFLFPGLSFSGMVCLLMLVAWCNCGSRWDAASSFWSIMAVQLAFIVIADEPEEKKPLYGPQATEVHYFHQIPTVHWSSQDQEPKSPPSGQHRQLPGEEEKNRRPNH